ncbi:MAG TPA: helix-turn-helix domain-containing protein [Blastocatellia bacterium]|nr:helix-turn-helix domain-containing protein [Blastocatellia bacterium]
MKLGDVFKKERERKRLTVDDAAARLGLTATAYTEVEGGSSPIEDWAPKLAEIAIKLATPTSRLISETGKSAQAAQEDGQCGRLIRAHRESRGLSRETLATQLGWPVEQLAAVESGVSPLEQYAPLTLRFAEAVDQPIFNLFYPCGLPFTELTDYP